MPAKKKNNKTKIMLIESTRKHKSGDLIEARGGYARYLVRFGIGIAEKGNEALIGEKLDSWRQKDAAKVMDSKKDEEKLKSISLNIQRRSGFNGVLYGSVTAADIANELREQGCNVRKRDIVVEQIRATGQYPVLVNLYGGGTVKVSLTVTGETA